jgi:hypothetical protein
MKETFFVNARIGLAIFLGVLGGPALAIRYVGVGDGLGLVTAALVGGSIAWVACGPLRLWRALCRAVRVVAMDAVHWFQMYFGVLIISYTLVLPVHMLRTEELSQLLYETFIGASFFALCAVAAFIACSVSHKHFDKSMLTEAVLNLSLKYINPLALICWACVLTYRSICWVLQSTPAVLGYVGGVCGCVGPAILRLPKNLYDIARLTFRYYHSTGTRICFTDAALFAGGRVLVRCWYC